MQRKDFSSRRRRIAAQVGEYMYSISIDLRRRARQSFVSALLPLCGLKLLAYEALSSRRRERQSLVSTEGVCACLLALTELKASYTSSLRPHILVA